MNNDYDYIQKYIDSIFSNKSKFVRKCFIETILIKRKNK